MSAYERACAALGAAPATAWRAPGRVNLIGEHVDYSGGLACPIAIERGTVAVARARADGRLRVVSADRTGSVELPLDERSGPRGAWFDYVVGTAYALADAGVVLRGADLAVASDLPIAAGLSSSAALELAAGAALLAVADAPLDRRLLAAAGRRAENAHVGARTGGMDQLIVAHARRDHALLIDCRSETTELVPIPPTAAIVVADTGTRHALAHAGYNDRRAESDAATRALGLAWLRDAEPSDLARLSEEPLLLRRARHVVGENARVRRFVDALRAGDLAAAGAAMNDSHRSLRDDYEVSIPELDALVAFAGAQPGVYGARMTGGGFGGAVVVLCARASEQELVRMLSERSRLVIGVRASDGITEIS